MSITTYTALKRAIADFAQRGDLENVIPTFISLAEARLSRALDHPNMSIRVSATVATTSAEPEFIDLPPRFQEMRRIYLKSVTGHPSLDYLSEGQIAKERPRWGGARGRPTHYTIFGTELELCPTPDSNYEIEMVYRSDLVPLTDADPINWLITLSPDVYLFGSLVHLAHYTGEADKFQEWDASYRIAMDELSHHGRTMKYGAAPIIVTIAGENTP